MYLHDLPEFADLLAIVGREHRIEPALVEKDYWIMHCLFGLQRARYAFELKGGTSLSKGYQLIHRFSEDIDIKIMPPDDLPAGKNQAHGRKVLFVIITISSTFCSRKTCKRSSAHPNM